jgi:TolB-like protein/Flp pilus assembly protein TadD
MSFIAELRQRKVFRVAAAYLVVAWVAVQAASIALPAFDAPDWVLRVVILVFALGFPLVLLLSWAVQVTPAGLQFEARQVGNKRMAAVAAVLVVLALAWYFVGQPAVRRQQVANERSIAVLPFANMSGDKANDYFSDGLAETTLDMLAQVPELKVIARTSSFAFKGRHADVREIGRALGAAHLLEGSVQQAGDTLRITAQLVRTSDGSHLWSKRFDRRRADVFAIQDEIATEVVRAIHGALPAAQQARLVRKRTDNVAAYEEYLKGIALLPQRNTAGLGKALAHFERAIELDPEYARAHAMAGTAALLLRTYGDERKEIERRIPRHIDRALELAPDLGEAWVARGAQLEWADDYAGAEKAYVRGLELAPGYATAHQWLGEFYQDQLGEMDKALPLLERATVLDPLSPIIRKEYATGLAAVQRVDEAGRVLDQLLQANPRFAPGHEQLALLRMQRGDLSGALRAIDTAIRLDPAVFFFPITRCEVLVRFRAMQAVKRCVDGLLAKMPGERGDVVRLRWLMENGEHRQALALIERTETQAPGARLQFEKAGLLFNLGRYAEAGVVLREVLAQGNAEPGEFRTPPVAESPWVEDQAFVGAIRLLQGEREAGTFLLEAAAKRAAARPPGSGHFARRWNDVVALAVLGRHEEACAAYRRSVEGGMFTDYDFAERMPVLDGFRARPCYPQVVAPARARAEAEIGKARAAGLL